MASITSTGLGSGIDINGMVDKLVAAEKAPVTKRLDNQEKQLLAKISALGTFKSALSDLQGSLSALGKANNFNQMSATSSDTNGLTVSALSNADAGSYQMTVKQLAQAHSLASKSFAAPTSTVGTGTLTIKFGTTTYDAGVPGSYAFSPNADKPTLSVTIDSSNNSLSGIRDAINNAKAGVTASIVNDGSGYRLVMSSQDSGAANSLQVSTTDSDGNNSDNSGLSVLAFDSAAQQASQTLAARDAIVNINGLDVNSTSNTVTTALKGVTLNLLQAQPSKPITVGVTANTADLTKSIQGFVDKYNAVIKNANDVATYNSKTKQAGALLGESTVNSALKNVRGILSSSVAGTEGSIRTLMDLGLKTQKDGSLTLDTTKLNNALNKDRSAVAAVFAPLGRPTDSGVIYLSRTQDTQAGNYDVEVTHVATRGALTGSAGAGRVIDASNNTLKIKVDGIESNSISLTQNPGYTGAGLAAELQSRINGDTNLKANGVSVAVEYDSVNDKMTLRSQRYGSASSVEITQIGVVGSGANIGGLTVASGTQGTDVAGKIGGVTASGSGRSLTGISGPAKGLSLQMDDDNSGTRGTVRFSRGLIEQLDTALTGIVGSKGSIADRLDGLQKSEDGITKSRKDLDLRMTTYQSRLLKQFNAMDRVVGSLQSTSNFLTRQFAQKTSNN